MVDNIGNSRDHDKISLTTIGVDVGSATSHVNFSRVVLQQIGHRLSSRYVPVERRLIYESPVILTPYATGYTIDAEALGSFIEAAYEMSGVRRHQVHTGAVILTGEAVKRRNARAISDALASMAGDFVCVTAGPLMEAVIAAHGSGAVSTSRQTGSTVVNVDVGGGTTKFAVIREGSIVETAALSVGARLIATNQDGRVSRAEDIGLRFAERLGIDLAVGGPLPASSRLRLGRAMAATIIDAINGRQQDDMWLTAPLSAPIDESAQYVFSGGVGQYVYRQEERSFGDLGLILGQSLRATLMNSGTWKQVLQPEQTIRATVFGASQYSVQLSGNTVYISDASIVPIRNLPVVVPSVDLSEDTLSSEKLARAITASLIYREQDAVRGRFALAFEWRGAPNYSRLKSLAHGIAGSVSTERSVADPLVLIIDRDLAGSIGAMLQKELGWAGPLLCIDGIQVGEFDFIDIGQPIEAAFPVVVKTLVFPSVQRQHVEGVPKGLTRYLPDAGDKHNVIFESY